MTIQSDMALLSAGSYDDIRKLPQKTGVRSCFLPLNSAIQHEVSSNKTHYYYNFNSTLGNKYAGYSHK